MVRSDLLTRAEVHTSFLLTNRQHLFFFMPLRGLCATMETVSRNVRLPVGREAPAFHHFSADAFPYSTRALHCSNTLTISTTQTPPAGNWPSRDPHKKEVLAMSSTLRVGQAAQVLGRSERSMHHLAWPTTAAGNWGGKGRVDTMSSSQA